MASDDASSGEPGARPFWYRFTWFLGEIAPEEGMEPGLLAPVPRAAPPSDQP